MDNLTVNQIDKHRLIFSGIFLSCLGLLLFGFFLQYYKNIQPCPLCYLQRVVFYFILGFSFLRLLHNPKKVLRKIYSLLIIVFAILGSIVAVRQVWLQTLPPEQVPPCIPSIDVMMKYMPWTSVIQKAFIGGGDCAKVSWSFLGISIAQWSLAWFIVYFIMGFMSLFAKTTIKDQN